MGGGGGGVVYFLFQFYPVRLGWLKEISEKKERLGNWERITNIASERNSKRIRRDNGILSVQKNRPHQPEILAHSGEKS